MQYQGVVRKMVAHIDSQSAKENTPASKVAYRFILSSFRVEMTPLIGQEITLAWTGQISCVSCGQRTPKSYAQGYCYRCFITKAECDLCIMKPETCHFAAGTCREPDWAAQFCFQPHVVYLANSSGVKVGITRQTQLPTRWLDQGATQALPILSASSRYLVGLLEVMLAQSVADKTNWRALLKAEAEPVDLFDVRRHLLDVHAAELARLGTLHAGQIAPIDAPVETFQYPVLAYPTKISSFNLEKTPIISGQLMGIKGQYLIFDTGVINIRKYAGYELELKTA